MRKLLTLALAVLQLGFLAGLIGWQKTTERHMAADAVEYEFAADGTLWVWGADRSLQLEIRQKGTVNFTDRYWEIVTGNDGLSAVRRCKGKPQNGAYIDARGHEDEYFYTTLSRTLPVSRAFEETFFPDLKDRYIEQCIKDYGEEPFDGEDCYGTDCISDPVFGNVFTVKAKVWKGRVEITDYLVNGKSIQPFILPEGDGNA